jgi:hypothetical protein
MKEGKKNNKNNKESNEREQKKKSSEIIEFNMVRTYNFTYTDTEFSYMMPSQGIYTTVF